MAEKKPEIIVFDLDYTLWPFWIDTHVTPPFHKSNGTNVVDAHGQVIRYYKDVPKILKHLSDLKYKLGIASRTSEIEGARQLLKVLDWDKFFTYKEIYPGCKKTHFSKIQRASGVPYGNMIFFDDEQRNITDVRTLGVLCTFVENGVTLALVEDSLKKYSRQ